jgi:hypothetical protein
VSPLDWTAVAAIGQLVAATISFLGLVFVAVQIRDGRKSADFQNLLEFDRRAAERESALLRAETEGAKNQAFFELVNFLETLAAALNAKLLPRVSRRVVREKLIDSIVVISEESSWHQKLFDGVTSETTFAELTKFMRRERQTIDKLAGARARTAHA